MGEEHGAITPTNIILLKREVVLKDPLIVEEERRRRPLSKTESSADKF